MPADLININKQETMKSTAEKLNKAISIDSIKEEKIPGLHLIKCVFKSCTFNHSPNYMSSIDGSERPTDKLLFEGDKELTHICFRIDGNEAYTVFEGEMVFLWVWQ